MNKNLSFPGNGDRKIAAKLAITFFIFYSFFTHGYMSSTDESTVLEATQSLYEYGDLRVLPAPCAYEGRDGNLQGCFAAGQSILAFPLYAAGRNIGEILPENWLRTIAGRAGENDYSAHSAGVFFVTLYAPLASGCLIALLFMFQRRLGVSVKSAAAACVLFGLTSSIATHSIYFLRHTTEALTVIGAFYYLIVFKQTGEIRPVVLASLLASLTILVRVPAAVTFPALAGYFIYALSSHWHKQGRIQLTRLVPAALLPACFVAAAHVTINQWKWGTWLQSPMTDQVDLFSTPFHIGVSGLLFSPGASIFIYSPLLLLLPWTLPRFFRQNRAETITIIAVFISLLVISAPFYTWHGYWSSLGSRYMFISVVLLLVPVGLWLDYRSGPIAQAALYSTTSAGIILQLAIMTVSFRQIIKHMGYPLDDHRMLFLFEPDKSPIIGLFTLFQGGHWDTWLYWFGHGWLTRPGHPALAALLLLLWISFLGLAARSTLNAVKSQADITSSKQPLAD